MAEVYVTTLELKSFTTRLDKVEQKVDDISTTLHQNEISSVKDYHALQDMITIAVENGNKEMQSSLKEYTKKTSEQLENIEKRVHTLEDEKKEIALFEVEQRKKDKKSTQKQIVVSIFLVIATFFVTALLNNFVATITAKKENDQWKTFQNTKFKSQVKMEQLPNHLLEELRVENYFC